MIRFPAEWEKQSALLIAWPDENGGYGAQLAEVEACYRQIANHVRKRQPLLILHKDPAQRRHIAALLGKPCTGVRFQQAAYDDIWVRDTAPLGIIRDDRLQLLNFRFNGWGGKYSCQADNALNRQLYEQGLFTETPMLDIDMVLEGGSIDSDGQGSLLTTRQCLQNRNRNPGLSKQAIESRLQNLLGVQRIHWLDQESLAGDDTDAHIDTLARFCSPDSIAHTSCDDETDPHYPRLARMAEQLRRLRTSTGQPYQLHALPLPKPIINSQGLRLPANYANFLLINGAVLVPVYDDPADRIALTRLTACFPEREVIAVPCRVLIHQYGNLHCMTMQFPRHRHA